MKTSSDALIIGGVELHSRLFIGTGKYGSDSLIPAVAEASGAEVITVALRRVDLGNSKDNAEPHPRHDAAFAEHVRRAYRRRGRASPRLSHAAGCGDWIVIEVISDTRHLLPDGYETAKATETLAAKEGFTVLPYMNPDLYVARDLVNAGAAAVMPLGAPIGTNRGLQTKEMVRILIEEISLPIVVDAGIGKPSQACEAMEMGAAACLVNTAIATAGDPVRMGAAFGEAVRAGRNAFLAKAGPVLQGGASASSPLTGFLGGHDEGAAS
ncbi:MAG: thiazole synthase [Bilophila wadsworthia]